MNRFLRAACVLGALTVATPIVAQQRLLPQNMRQFVKVDAPVVALTHARLIDGTGSPAQDDQTIVIRGEKIETVGKTGSVSIPFGAQVIDVSGKTVIPGIIGLHDHMYYGGMQFMGQSYPRLFLTA